MTETHLHGLEGTNPLGFMAALGVQVVFAEDAEQPRLWWSEDVTQHAVVDGPFSMRRIADRAMEVFAEWKAAPAVNPARTDGSAMPKGDELKLAPEDIRDYLERARRDGQRGALAAALVAEGGLDKQGVAKPSHLYFTAGQQKFLSMARRILAETTRADLLVGLEGPWAYASALPSLMWDIADDRTYALAADDPGSQKKLTNPGPEGLALLGLSLHPVFADKEQTLTQGCSGPWKTSSYSWPLWSKPAKLPVVRSLLAHAYDITDDRVRWLAGWGVTTILRAPIRRTDQGGYGTFGPPTTMWRASRTR